MDELTEYKRELIKAFHDKYPMLNEEHREMMVALPLGSLLAKMKEYKEWAECCPLKH